MRIVISVFGTTGDIYPLMALAAQLRQRGHAITFAALPEWRTLVERAGYTFAALGIELGKQFRAFLRNEIDGIASAQHHSLITLLAPRVFQELQNACMDADLLIGAADQPIALMVHEVLKIPYCSFLLPYPYAELLRFQRSMITEINPWRQKLGLPPLKPVCPAMPLVGASPQLMLLAMSPQLLRPLPTWPAHFHVTGTWFSTEAVEHTDTALESFLAEGTAPVVITFGSMVHHTPRHVTAVLVEAVKHAACRAMIQRGWSELGEGCEPQPDIYFAGAVPHGWLFPRAACVVHHCGIGTMNATVLAGTPMVCVPHVFDQFDLSSFAQTFGYASGVIPYQELEAGRLAEAIRAAIEQPSYRAAAVRHAALLRAERGVEHACDLIEQTV